VTVLFADLVGSTALQERLDPESARGVMQRYYSLVADVIAAHGGRVVKFIGDGAMAVFGVPETREDDARRALGAALALHEHFARLAGDVSQLHGAWVSLRVGVNTGEVVVSGADDDVVGDAVNVAARLERAAEPGGVLVGEPTWRLARGQATFGDTVELHVAGKAEAVRVRPLLALQERAVEPRTVLVGRYHELALLEGAFDDVVRTRSPRLVTVLGSPGVGKTRLASELGRSITERATVLVARCTQQAEAPLAPLAEMLHATLATTAADAVATSERLRAFVGDDPDSERVLGTISAVLEAGGGATPEETLWAVRRLVEQRSRASPVLIVVDDLQWGEAMLLDVVEHLAEWTRGPLLLVVLARPELRERRAALTDGARHTVLALDGLDGDETVRLACDLLGADSLPPALVERLGASTGGNPLFVRELVGMLVDDGVLQTGGDGWELRVAAAAIDVPPTIQALLAARLDRLAPDERLVLERASVWGTEFPLGALVALLPSGALHPSTVLEQLWRKDLVEGAGTYWVDEPVYRFHHVLIRDAAYRRLLRETRAVLHEQLAAWLEAKTAAVGIDYDELVGHHLEQAYLQRRELGALDDHAVAVGRAAGARLGTAAQRALDRDDPSAARLAERALGCLPRDEPGRADLLVVRCDALLGAADTAAAREAVAELAELAVSPRLRAWSECFAAQLATIADPAHLRDTERRAAAVAAELAALGDTRGAAKAHAVHAGALARLGRFAEVEEALDRALTAAREAGDRRLATMALAAAPVAAVWGPSPVPRAGGRCLDVVRLLRITAGSPAVEATSLRCQGVLEAFRGRTDAARRLVGAAREMLEELGLVHGLLEADLFAGIVELDAGDLDAAEACLRRAFDGLRALGAGADAARAGALLARAALQRGALDDAERLARDAGELAGDDLPAAIVWRRVAAEVLARRGEHDEARRLAEAAVAIASETDALVQHADACLGLAAVLRATGDVDGAAPLIRQAAELYDRKGATALAELARAVLKAPPTAPPTDVSSSVPAILHRNVATEVYARRAAALTAGDHSALAALASADYVFDDRRAVVGVGRNNSPRMKDATYQMIAEGYISAGEAIAVRGGRLALIEASTRVGADGEHYTTDSLLVLELDADGLAAAAVLFDPDDVDAAIDELDHRYIAGEGAAYAEVLALVFASLRAYNARDWEALRACNDPDVVVVDRMRGGWYEQRGVDTAIAAYQSQLLGTDARSVIRSVRPISSDAILLSITTSALSAQGGDLEEAIAMSYRRGPRGIDHVELLPPARFTEHLEAQSGPTYHGLMRNRCTQVFGEWAELFAGRDWGAMAQMVADEYVYEDHRPVVSVREEGRAQHVATMQVLAGQGGERVASTVLAVRGERLALVRLGVESHADGAESFASVMLAAVEISADDRLGAVIVYGLDDEDGAAAELDRRYVLGEGSACAQVVSVVVEVTRAWDRGDWGTVRSFCAPGMVAVDHRAGSFGTGTIDELIRTVRDPPGGGWRTAIRAIHAVSSDALLGLLVRSGRDDGGAEIEWACHVAYRLGPGGTTQLDIFAVDALDDARAAFVQMAAPPLTNRATEGFQVMAVRFAARDWDALGAALNEDFVSVDQRSVVATRWDGREAGVANLQLIAAQGADRLAYSTIAVRGEHLALVRLSRQSQADGEESFASVVLGVVQADDHGRLASTTIYGLEDEEAAVAELERQYLEGEGRDSPALRATVELNRAYNARDWPAIAACYAPSCTFVDHRTPGWGTLLGLDAWTERLRGLLALVPEARLTMSAVHALRADAIAYGVEVRGRSDDSGTVEWACHLVNCLDGGAITRCELFAPEDLEGVLVAFHPGTAHGPRLRNRCTAAAERLCQLLKQQDWEALSDLCGHPGFTGEEHRRGLGGMRGATFLDQLEGTRSAAEFGVRRLEHRAIAVRGDALALGEFVFVVGPDETAELEVRCLAVNEVGADGRFRFGATFDPEDLDGAVGSLEERYLQGEGAPFAEMVRLARDANAAYNARDWGGAGFAPDVVSIDHRPVGWGTVHGRVALVEAFHAMLTMVPDARLLMTAVQGLSDRSILYSADLSGHRVEGGPVELPFHIAMQRGTAGIERVETFAVEDLAGALAAFAPSGPEPVSNLCTRRQDELCALFAQRDWERFGLLFAAGFDGDDHRRGYVSFVADPVASFGAAADLGTTRMTSRPLAARGERVALSLWETWQGDSTDAAGIECLFLCEVDSDGRFVWMTSYDLDALAAAMHDLEDRYTAAEGAEHTDVWRVVCAWRDAFNARDWESLSRLLDHDVVLTDHNLRSYEARGREQVLALSKAIAEASRDALRFKFIDAIAPHGAVVSVSATPPGTASADFETVVLHVLGIRGGMVLSCDIYAPDGLAEARARFAELEAPVPGPTPPNRAWDAVLRAQQAAERGDRAAFEALHAPGYRYHDRRAGLGTTSEAVQAVTATDYLFEGASAVNTLLAIRGDHLALHHGLWRARDGFDWEIEILATVEVDRDGRITSNVVFDDGDLDAAFVELDGQYLGQLHRDQPELAPAWGTVRRWNDTFNRRDWAALRELATPSYVLQDHRPANYGLLDAEAAWAMFAAVTDLTPGLQSHFVAVEAISERAVLLRTRIDGAEWHGTAYDTPLLIAYSLDGGAVDAMEFFALEDGGEARRRFAALAALA
jgi:class 3 adenylate cyclase/tetratricopeptide (TPR) repeat protein